MRILGGTNGVPHRYVLYSKEQPPRAIQTKETGLVIQPGDVLVLESGGGGGWGDPANRDRDAIARDIDNGFVTKEIRAAASSPPPLAAEG